MTCKDTQGVVQRMHKGGLYHYTGARGGVQYLHHEEGLYPISHR